MSVKIADCTIRDGGYLLGKNSSSEFIKGIVGGLVESGIDFVETGFLQSNSNGETLVYSNSTDAIKYIPKCCKKSSFIGFCDNSRYSIEKLDSCTGDSFTWIRISFAKHEMHDAIVFCKEIIEKGYSVQFNPMDALSYSVSERNELIEAINSIEPNVVSIVDTFGAMDMIDLREIFRQFDKSLNSSIAIGLHSHDNLGLSCALAEYMIELSCDTDRDVVVDGSLFGMGRGAGNAKTEIIANYINKHVENKYNIEVLIDTIEKYIEPLMTDISWGYNLPMFICGSKHAHVDNVYYLKEHYGCNSTEIYNVINSLSIQQRIRYGINYRKDDFSILDDAYKKYKKI